ncbi:MAG TPA: GAP family protein [Ornithinibacter sp.]|nr:GAP family protein [Ornithinibacter sp.]
MTGDLVPLAIGILASPFPVIPVILLLLTPRATANAGAFLGGWAAGVLAGTAVFVALANVIDGFEETPTWVSWARVLLGGALVIVGVRQFMARHESKEAPGWMRALDDATPASAVRLGALLSGANPKILLLSAAAGLTIAAADLTAGATVATVVIFALVGSLSVALPLVVHLVLGDRAQAPLLRAKEWLTEHNATIMVVVMLVIGGLLLSNGISGL